MGVVNLVRGPDMRNEEQRSALLETALWWAEQGVPVFPCGADKIPLTKRGFKDAVVEEQAVIDLFSAYGSRAVLVGGRMGKDAGMFAIDVDLYKGVEVEEWLAGMMKRGLITDTRTHKTMRGGVHFLYESDSFPNVYPVDGVEVRGEGAYIIMAGSPGYTVLREGIATASKELVAELKKKQASHTAETVDDLKKKILRADNFHDSLSRLAARYSASGWPMEKVLAALRETMAASVASDPSHDRHGRWKFLMMNEGDEFVRMATTSNTKYNSQHASDSMAADIDVEKLRQTASKAFAGGATGSNTNFEPEPEKVYDGLSNPFLGHFAHEERDLLNQKYLFPDLLAEKEVLLVHADPKAGKTAIMLTLGLHLSCGVPLGGMQIPEPRSVLYFGLEGRVAIERRILAWRIYMETSGISIPEEIPFFMSIENLNMMEKDVRKDLVSRVVAYEAFLLSKGYPPLGLVVIDTFTKAMLGGDQNSAEDTSQIFEFNSLMRNTESTTAICYVHHNAKNTGASRGSSNIEAEPDVICGVYKEGEVTRLSVTSARSIESGNNYGFKLEGITLGENSQGINITAPVAVPIDYAQGHANPEADIAAAQQTGKTLSLLVGMGRGSHPLTSVNRVLVEAGMAVMTASARRGVTKPKPAAVNTQKVQEFYLHLIPVTGYVFGGFSIQRIMEGDSIVGLLIK
jgi:hypothetical protein